LVECARVANAQTAIYPADSVRLGSRVGIDMSISETRRRL
jgi:hypothetical protein